MKLGRAVEISPSVFREQFTSCDKISQAASADSLLLSTLKQNEFHVQKALQIHFFFPLYLLKCDVKKNNETLHWESISVILYSPKKYAPKIQDNLL